VLKAFPVAGKQKSTDICRAFIAGAPESAEGSVFYGVNETNCEAWHRADGDRWYIDNAYFDTTRQTYFRITKNATQHSGLGKSDGMRFRSLGIPINPWRKGSHIVVVQQSESFMRHVAKYYSDYVADAIVKLSDLTDRSILVRLWNRNKHQAGESLLDDLRGAHALVTHSSAAAVTALLEGVPVAVDRTSAAYPMAGSIDDIESLPRLDRENWAGVLADNQWTLDEMRNGTAWLMLNEQGT
jgi:hypothetical protein